MDLWHPYPAWNLILHDRPLPPPLPIWMSIVKFIIFSNKIYEKLKEVVEKVNPLLANTTSFTNKNEDIVEVEYAPVEEDAVIVDGE